MNQDVLNSWKEIASYLGRGVRTVQRWERELNLPIRRPRAKERSAVLALKSELDQWLKKGHTAHQRVTKNSIDHERLQKNADLLIARANELLSRSQKLRDQVATAMALGASLMKNHPLQQRVKLQVGRQYADETTMAKNLGSAGGGRIES